MKPGYRMASEESPVRGHDLKSIFIGVLGSNGRAIVSSKTLMDTLLEEKLVTADANYYFSHPWQTEKLNQLGIRYLLLESESPELKQKGWKLLKVSEYLHQKYFLYENPSEASLVYLIKDKKMNFLKDYQLIGNAIKIKLPEINSNQDLVVTFLHRKEWKASIDGKETTPLKTSLGMIKIPLTPGNKNVTLQY
jgi:hypothetical protein